MVLTSHSVIPVVTAICHRGASGTSFTDGVVTCPSRVTNGERE
jgi:hypothetical protein